MEIPPIITSVFLLLVTVVIYMVYLSLSRKSQTFRKMGIPGPAPWPLVGNFPQLLTEGFMYYHTRLYKEFENEKVYTVTETGKEFLIIKDLDMIRDICIKHFNHFVNRRVFFDRHEYDNILTQLKDDHWRHVRNTVSPTFSSGKLKRVFGHVEESSRIFLSNLKQLCEEGKSVEIKEMASYFSMDAIASSGFGFKVDSLNDKDSEFVRQAKKIMNSFTNPEVVLALTCPRLGYLMDRLGVDVFSTKAARYFSSFVDVAMSNRQKGESKRQDFLQLVVDAETQDSGNSAMNAMTGQHEKKGLTHAEIQGTGLIFILAGYDTVSTTIAFTMFLLAHHPECREKLQEELDKVLEGTFPTYENVPELTYMDMCINETLRLYPPGFLLDRQCSEDCDIGGFHIPKNTYIAFPVMAIHHDPKLWPEPEKFNPERFTAANKEGRHPFAHLPFGQGPRNCIGMRLALLEMKVAMGSILQEMSPVSCEKSVYPPVLDKNLTKAVDGLWVKFEHRNN